MQKITPCLWFDNNLDEAIALYTKLFPDVTILEKTQYGEAGPGKPGSVLTATFEVGGQRLMCMNGGPYFKFNEAISLFVLCEDQAEVDHYWNGLTADGGEESQCGWLKDKFGLSWQIIPKDLGKLLGDPDREKADRVMKAMLEMQKIEIDALYSAYYG